MDKTQLTELKTFYENTLIEKLAEALKYNKNQFTAKYTIDALSAHIDLTSSDIVVIYDFTYRNGNLVVDMENYKVLFSDRDGVRTINGAQSQKMTTDLQTLAAIAQIFEQVLAMDMPVRRNEDAVEVPATDIETETTATVVDEGESN